MSIKMARTKGGTCQSWMKILCFSNGEKKKNRRSSGRAWVKRQIVEETDTYESLVGRPQNIRTSKMLLKKVH